MTSDKPDERIFNGGKVVSSQMAGDTSPLFDAMLGDDVIPVRSMQIVHHHDHLDELRAANEVIAQQDARLERYHRHLAAVYRVARLACLLIGGGLLFGVIRDVAQGVDPWMPTLRLAGASWCLVTWRWTRRDEQAWRAGR